MNDHRSLIKIIDISKNILLDYISEDNFGT